MSLSCECPDYDWADRWWMAHQDFAPLKTKRGRKCCSCGTQIKPGDDCLVIDRGRNPQSDVEERIYGDEVPLAPKHMCEECGGLYMAVDDLGLCYALGNNIKTDVREWAEAQQYEREQQQKADART